MNKLASAGARDVLNITNNPPLKMLYFRAEVARYKFRNLKMDYIIFLRYFGKQFL